MRILITGISGFVGPYLARACLQHYAGCQIYGMTYEATLPASLHDLPVALVHADITNRAEMAALITQANPDLIFHLAAQSSVAHSWRDPVQTLLVNAGGAIHLFEAVIAAGITPRLILIGSSEEYGIVPPEANPVTEQYPCAPMNPYAISKVTQGLYAAQYYHSAGLPIIRVRPFNHFGPFQAPLFVIPSFCQQIARIEAHKEAPLMRTGNLDVQRDFLPVTDVVAAYVALAQYGHPGEVYNVGSGRARSVREVLQQLLTNAQVPITTEIDPNRLRPVDMPVLTADTALLYAHTGWQPQVDFDQALLETLAYWRAVEQA